MMESTTRPHELRSDTDFDVAIIGAGIAGIGAAYHLTSQCPNQRFVVLESQASFGGTWLTHKYPGIRSDSDLYTFGYRFKPWKTSVGSCGWPGKYSTVWYNNDPAGHLTIILMMQRAYTGDQRLPMRHDFWTAVYQAIDD